VGQTDCVDIFPDFSGVLKSRRISKETINPCLREALLALALRAFGWTQRYKVNGASWHAGMSA